MALYLHSPPPIRINAMTLNEAQGQRLVGTSELLFPSEFKVLYMYVMYAYMHACMYIFSRGAAARSGPGSPHYRGFTITLRHTTFS